MRSFSRAAVVALTFSFAPAVMQAQVKIAFVRSQALLETAPGRATAESTFAKELQALEATSKRMQDSLQVMVESYQKAQSTLTAAQKETRETAIRTRQQDYATRQQQMQQQAQSRQAELIAPVIAKVREILEDIRASDGYTVILDLESPSQAVLAYDKNLDITERVIARLKTTPAPAAAAASPASTAKPGAPVAAPAGVTRPKPSTL